MQPEISNENKFYFTQTRQKFKLICEYPKIEPFYVKLTSIKWYKGNFENKKILEKENLDDSGILEFSEFNYWDEYNYTCVAVVGLYLTKFTTIRIFAIEKPVIIHHPKDISNENVGENIKFECKFEIPIAHNNSIILQKIFTQMKINWYFQPLNFNDSWIRIKEDEKALLNFTINKNQILSKLNLIKINNLNLGYYKCEINIENFNSIISKPAYFYSNSK